MCYLALTSEVIISLLLESTALVKWICDTERENEREYRRKGALFGQKCETPKPAEKCSSSQGTRKSFIPQKATFE